MSNREIDVTSSYAEAIFQRAQQPMEPRNFAPNWEDQPSRYKIYSAVERIPLPIHLPESHVSVAEVLERMHAPRPGNVRTLDFAEVATTLLIAHGVLTRRLGITWNRDHRNRSRYHQTTYGRGTASGGGMYPTEIYWVSGGSGSLLPGVYHYDNAHHALARLYTGDVTPHIRAATFGQKWAATTDHYLLISLNFWKNAFKYNSFSYHVVTQDLGALLGSLRLLVAGFGSEVPFIFWYQDMVLNQLLGLDTLSESTFVVVPLPMASTTQLVGEAEREKLAPSQVPDHFLIEKSSFQRSRNIIRFPMVEEVHQAALIEAEAVPMASKAFGAACDHFSITGEPIALPEPDQAGLQADIIETFKKRRSSFGRFSSHTPLLLNELATLLYFGASSCNYLSDLKPEDGALHFTRLLVFANNVQGLERGVYAYDYERHCLWIVQQNDMLSFLQTNYFLQNYNMCETGAVIAIAGRVAPMLETYGNRGYRMLNAEVGLVAQNIYIASTALSVGCGAVLGFDNVNLNTALGLDGSDYRSLLFLLIGHERPYTGDFEERLV